MTKASASSSRMICLGVAASPHGVKGAFKVKTFTEAEEDIAAYGPLTSEDGKRTFRLKVLKVLKPGLVLATSPDVQNREQASLFTGTKLFVDRAVLPGLDEDDAYYHEDLVGLTAQTGDGQPAGKVSAVHNFGAGDILELKDVPGRMGSVLVPFTLAAVPEVDLATGKLIVTEDALNEGTGEPEQGEGASAEEIDLIDTTGELASDDAALNLEIIKQEDA